MGWSMGTTGIVIEGGAMRSIYAAGVLDYFLERKIEIPNVLAVSAGAYAGMNYVSGQKGRVLDAVIKPLKEYKYLGLGTFLKKGTFFDMEYLFNEVPKKKAPFDFDTFSNSAKRFLISTTDCLTGKCIYHDRFQDQDEFWKICKTANSLPFIARITSINGVPMLDGGVADAIPVRKALEEGWDKFIVILTRKEDYRKKYRPLYQFFVRLIYRKYPELVRVLEERADTYNQSLDLVKQLEREGKVLVFRPTKIAIKNQESDVKTLLSSYQHGYRDAESRYEEIRNFLTA